MKKTLFLLLFTSSIIYSSSSLATNPIHAEQTNLSEENKAKELQNTEQKDHFGKLEWRELDFDRELEHLKEIIELMKSGQSHTSQRSLILKFNKKSRDLNSIFNNLINDKETLIKSLSKVLQGEVVSSFGEAISSLNVIHIEANPSFRDRHSNKKLSIGDFIYVFSLAGFKTEEGKHLFDLIAEKTLSLNFESSLSSLQKQRLSRIGDIMLKTLYFETHSSYKGLDNETRKESKIYSVLVLKRQKDEKNLILLDIQEFLYIRDLKRKRQPKFSILQAEEKLTKLTTSLEHIQNQDQIIKNLSLQYLDQRFCRSAFTP